MVTATISSKGQITIPLSVRKEQGLEKGTSANIQSTLWGISIIKVPSKPLLKLRGILKGAKLSSKDIRYMRQKDDKTKSRFYPI